MRWSRTQRKTCRLAVVLLWLGTFFFLPAKLYGADSADWQAAKAPLMTRWAPEVSPTNIAKEYPRPQLVRHDWQSLDGLWDYAIRSKQENAPDAFDGKILVPFPVESALSGVMKRVGEADRLWYRRSFQWPESWRGRRAILHFGAIDWQAVVSVNGHEVGTHQGGYTPLEFDITDALNPSGEQTLTVSVWDPTDAAAQPRGKQVAKPSGIWYSPVTGIWQTVWIEPVSPTSVKSLRIVPDIDTSTVTVDVELRGEKENVTLRATATDGSTKVAETSGAANQPLKLSIPNAKLWTPDAPNLYSLTISVSQKGKLVDEVSSYFGMRKISLVKDKDGNQRLGLNGQPLFQFGPLDQGWWPDGLYTAPTDAALKYDIETMKKLGFNMARKHVKVEPDRWYYWCDKLGLLVWQDMPSGFATNRKQEKDKPFTRSDEEANDFEAELKEMIDSRRNHPSIVIWVPFNENWGQYDTARIVQWIKQYDPTRLVDNASGWNDAGVGDVHDIHDYPGPKSPQRESSRAIVLGEFGGLGLPLSGHTWQAEKNWGYRSFENTDKLNAAYLELVGKLRELAQSSGLSAAVYTQITDVESEVNGLMTYDRAVIKVDVDQAGAANRSVINAAAAQQ